MRKSSFAIGLLAALGAFSLPTWAFRDQHGRVGRKASKNSAKRHTHNAFHPGNGARECARRVRQNHSGMNLRHSTMLEELRSNENKRAWKVA